MQKIKLKIKPNQLKVLNTIFTFEHNNVRDVMERKVLASLEIILYNKLMTLEVKKRFSNEPFTIKFKYYEAYFLFKLLSLKNISEIPSNDELETIYNNNILLKIYNDLHQQLT